MQYRDYSLSSSVSSSGSGWPWWAWVLLFVAAMVLAAASLLVPRNRWFGRVERWEFWRRMRERVHARRSLVYVYAGLFAGVVAVLVVWPLPSLLTRHPRVVDAVARHTVITNTRTGLVGTLAALGAGVGLAYTARTYRLSREGHLTDRYTRAVEQLGSDKIGVRLGGIYALERLMHDSPADQPTIIEVLAAYIRQHAPRTNPTVAPAPSVSTRPRIARARRALPDQPDADVQAVLSVLGRRTVVAAENPIGCRSGLPWAFDLTGTHLAGVQLQKAILSDVCLDRVNLTCVGLVLADLTGAGLGKTILTDAYLVSVNLTNAYLVEADLTNARLGGATLTQAGLGRTNLTNAYLAGAHLTNAYLVGANLTNACLFNADLTGAQLTRGALTEKQLADALNVETIKWREVEEFVAEPS